MVERRDPRVSVNPMPAAYATELERLLEHARELLGAGDDTLLHDANIAVNHALQLTPDCVDAWLLKAQIASATGDDLAALAAVEMALHRSPHRAEALYWRGAVLGDLGRHREAIEAYLEAVKGAPQRGKASFNLACAYALIGEKEKALAAAEQAVAAGYRVKWSYQNDADLESIRGERRFQALLASL